MILYLRYCRTGVLFHITVHVKDQYVTTYDDVILVKPNRICRIWRATGILGVLNNTYVICIRSICFICTMY